MCIFYFFRYCSTLLRELLPQWEFWIFNPFEPKPGLGQRLKQLLITYKVGLCLDTMSECNTFLAFSLAWHWNHRLYIMVQGIRVQWGMVYT